MIRKRIPAACFGPDPLPVRKLEIGLLAVLALALQMSGAPAQGQPSATVRVAEAIRQAVAPSRSIPGTVIGRNDAKIAAQEEGLLRELTDVGVRVRKGDVLARIEATQLELEVNEAAGGVAALEARHGFLQRESERLERLAQQNNMAKNALDKVQSDVLENDANLRGAKSRLGRARDRLSRTVIRAPFDGVVTERYQSVGDNVDINEQILRFVDTGSLEISVRVPQEATVQLKPGKDLQVSDGVTARSARIRALVPVGDDTSRLYELRLEFDHTAWLAGQALRIEVPLAAAREVTLVPRDALVIRQEDVTVYRIDAAGMAEAVPVKVGIARDSMVEVQGQIAPGDRVVIRGNERLRPGQPVQILTDTASP